MDHNGVFAVSLVCSQSLDFDSSVVSDVASDVHLFRQVLWFKNLVWCCHANVCYLSEFPEGVGRGLASH